MRRRRAAIQNNFKRGSLGKGDRSLFFAIIGLVTFGSLMVFSGSVPIAALKDLPPYYYFMRQLIFVALGMGILLFTYNFDYHLYPKLVVPGLIVTALLLIVVLFTPEINETNRWLDLGFTTIQVSDIAKLTLTLYFASWLSKPPVKKNGESIIRSYIKYNLLPFLLVLGFFSGLIIIEPDLSTTALIGIISLSIYYISGTDILNTIGTAGIFITMGLSGLVAGIIAPYRFQRLTSFIGFIFSGQIQEPYGRDYQLRQILIAVGTGGFLGEGFAQSKQKFSYLTETAFSDSIFAIFAEEFGFLGSIVLVLVYVWIMFEGFKIAKNAPDKLGSLIASGLTIWISMQAFIHFAVNVGLIPLTGMPLPFISYGGSSLVTSLAAIGILINISRFSDKFS